MALIVNTAEGGSNGVAATTGNSGGSSGDALSRFILGTSGTIVYDNAVARNSLSYKITPTAAGGSAAYIGWDVPNTPTQLALRLYVYFDALPSSVQQHIRILNSEAGGVNAINVFIGNTGAVGAQNSAGTTVWNAGATVSAGTWYRFEIFCANGAGTGQTQVAFYAGDSATALADSGLLTSQNNGSSTLGAIRVGKSSAGGTWTSMHIDNLTLNDGASALIGPALVGPTALTPCNDDRPAGQKVSGAASAETGCFSDATPGRKGRSVASAETGCYSDTVSSRKNTARLAVDGAVQSDRPLGSKTSAKVATDQTSPSEVVPGRKAASGATADGASASVRPAGSGSAPITASGATQDGCTLSARPLVAKGGQRVTAESVVLSDRPAVRKGGQSSSTDSAPMVELTPVRRGASRSILDSLTIADRFGGAAARAGSTRDSNPISDRPARTLVYRDITVTAQLIVTQAALVDRGIRATLTSRIMAGTPEV